MRPLNKFIGEAYAAYLLVRKPIADLLTLLAICLLGMLLLMVATNFEVIRAGAIVAMDSNQQIERLNEIPAKRCGISL